jgi:predicted TIM-barrel fold metal-dependent hydrolase
LHRRAFLALPLAASAASKGLTSRLIQNLESVETVDTHEHIIPESQRVSGQADFFTLASHYAINDVISAGLPAADAKRLESPDVSLAEKWKLFGPHWEHARFTGYGEALRIAVRDIYGFERIAESTLPRINEAIAAKNKPGLYRDILKGRMRLRFAVNDQYWQPKPAPVDSDFFALAQKFDGFVMPVTAQGLRRLESTADATITSLSGLKRAMEKTFERALRAGMVTVKSTAAYQRDLHFREVSEADAARDFDRLVKDAEPPMSESYRLLENRPYRNLADHMFHHLVSLADAHTVPFQIHTGLQAGNGNLVTNSRPADLTNLVFRFPRVAFDLFHIGYPYWRECAVLAKTFPNVHIDFCWMHIVSPSGARIALHEMLDSVPANKIMGYGGDYRYPELSYAHLVVARRNIAQVLAERVESGQNTEEEAARIGRWLMADNPARLFARK